MVFLNISPNNISSYILSKNGKIKKTNLDNLLKHDNERIGLIEIKIFGISKVYSLIDLQKVRQFQKQLSNQHSTQNTATIVFATHDNDVPLEDEINMRSGKIDISEFTIETWLYLYQIKKLIDGLNLIAENDDDNEYIFDLKNPNFSLEYLDFSYTDMLTDFIVVKDGTFRYCNSMHNLNTDGFFIRIPLLDCWQYLSSKKYKSLSSVMSAEIKYAVTDSPRCFSQVGYHKEYYIDSFNELLQKSVYIPINIYFNKVFETKNNIEYKIGYDAIEIVLNFSNYTLSVLLTHDELGISSIDGTARRVGKSNNHPIYMDNFCLLKLINNAIQLKPY